MEAIKVLARRSQKVFSKQECLEKTNSKLNFENNFLEKDLGKLVASRKNLDLLLSVSRKSSHK